MIIITKREAIFKIKQIWFSDSIFDVKDCDVVIFLNCKKKFEVKGFRCQESLTSIIDLSLSLDEIWRRMDKKSCRYAIKRAEREGVIIKINEGFEKFYKIYEAFCKLKGLKHLLEKKEILQLYGTLFTAEINGEILVGHVYLEDPEAKIMRYWKAASIRPWVDKNKASLIGNVSHLIHWEAIKYAKSKGFKEFDMGGLFGTKESGGYGSSIDAFKESFGGEKVVRYSYEKVYNKLYSVARIAYRRINRLRLFSR